MKYICTMTEENKEEIFIFSNTIDHDCMAESLTRIKNKTYGDWIRILRFPISAGFVDSKLNCYGRSVTLNLESRLDKDTKLLKSQML